ncbi:MAG TPA: alpha/beta fold hydrolase [Thermoanaerobaculia bacterium]|nr:alpha/beta fold hydrolase [Thermoanaerobaculia bacterium]
MIGAFAITVGIAAAALVPPRTETGFLNRELTVGQDTYRYEVYLPAAFDESRRWPVILFLHASSERGSDGVRPTSIGLGAAIRSNPERFPAIVVFPQVPEGKPWAGDAERAALEALDNSVEEFHGDPDRVYVVGISMGARGALQLAAQHPDRFAAVVAVGGWVVPPKQIAELDVTPPPSGANPYASLAEGLKGLPCRLYAGSRDTIVPPSESRRLALALHDLGADVKYNEFPDVGHAAWEKAFADSELWSWMFTKRRTAGSSATP